MDKIAEASTLARRCQRLRAQAHRMERGKAKDLALEYLGLARLGLDQLEQTYTEGVAAQVDTILDDAEHIIDHADDLPTEPPSEREHERTNAMTAKNETPVTADPMAAIAQMMANQTAMMAALMEKVSAPANAPTAKPKSALPEPAKPTAKSVSVTASAGRATASTVVYQVADHSVLWADRGVSIDRKALESIGNPQSVTITITPKA